MGMSKEQKRAILNERLQDLRSVSNSQAETKMSILADASAYILELQQKISRLTLELAEPAEQPPMVNVQVVDNGFLINVCVDQSCPKLLASILGAFDQLGLTVHEARASCAGAFRLEAVGEEDEGVGPLDAYAVEQAVVRAIRNCPCNYD